jgi:hypothetical protein
MVHAHGALLLDHDNLPSERLQLASIINAWLDSVSRTLELPNQLTLLVRAYGGWYRGNQSSDARFKATDFYLKHCPSLLMHGSRYCRIAFEFADRVFSVEPTNFATSSITHTVATRRSSQRFSKRKDVADCQAPDCEIGSMRKWLNRNRACTRIACPFAFGDHFERHEQKQVDVHLAADLLTWAFTRQSTMFLAVATDDIDLTPALVAAATHLPTLERLTLIRFDVPVSYLDDGLQRKGMNLITL